MENYECKTCKKTIIDGTIYNGKCYCAKCIILVEGFSKINDVPKIPKASAKKNNIKSIKIKTEKTKLKPKRILHECPYCFHTSMEQSFIGTLEDCVRVDECDCGYSNRTKMSIPKILY